jgi:hypothetical protein
MESLRVGKHPVAHPLVQKAPKVYVLFDTRGYLPLLGSRPKITLS